MFLISGTCRETTYPIAPATTILADASCSFDGLFGCTGWDLAAEEPDCKFIHLDDYLEALPSITGADCYHVLRSPLISVPKDVQSASVHFWLKVHDSGLASGDNSLTPKPILFNVTTGAAYPFNVMFSLSEQLTNQDWVLFEVPLCNLKDIQHLNFIFRAGVKNSLTLAIDDIVTSVGHGESSSFKTVQISSLV